MGFNVVIIGTGIGGLGAAIALASKGHQVTVLEATSKLQAIGGIIVMQPNANRIMDQWGIYKTFLRICREQPFELVQRRYTGEELCRRTDAMKIYGYPLWNVHRADFQKVLYEAAVERGANIRLGCPVTSVDEATPSVTLKSGEVVRGDLIVGADGMKSIVRDSINAESERGVTETGMDITRFNIPKATLESDPLTADIANDISLWFGPRSGFAHMPLLHDGEWSTGFDALHPPCPSSSPGSGRPQDLEYLKDYYSTWCPSIRRLFDYLDEAHVWRINETMPAKWVSDSGRVVLVGDACHAVLPNAGQGGCLALEDGVTVAECLSRAESKHDIPRVLGVYQAIRESRCRLVQYKARWLQQGMFLPNGPAQQARDDIFRNHRSWQYDEPWDGQHIDDAPSDMNGPNYMAWQNGHDARLFANRKLDELLDAGPVKKMVNGLANGHVNGVVA